jgi:hypothetical protein
MQDMTYCPKAFLPPAPGNSPIGRPSSLHRSCLIATPGFFWLIQAKRCGTPRIHPAISAWASVETAQNAEVNVRELLSVLSSDPT